MNEQITGAPSVGIRSELNLHQRKYMDNLLAQAARIARSSSM